MTRVVTALSLTILAAAGLLYTQSLAPAVTDFPIYFENSTLALKSETIDGITYLPLLDIVRHLGLAYTDATGSETFTIQGQNSRLVLTAGNTFVSLNDQEILLQDPIRHDKDRWLVSLDFLSQGLSRVSGLEFRYRPGSPRVFAGKVAAAELVLDAQTMGSTTRLTLRSGSPLDVELQKEGQHRAVLRLKGKPVDPARERLAYKDSLVQSVVFNDSDGSPKLLVGIADDVHDIRITASEENLLHFVDFSREPLSETTLAPAAPSPAPEVAASAPEPNVRSNVTATGGIRVIAIDAGHGGIDSGAANAGTLEKDITLSLARQLRTALQNQLGSTVILTRDSDVALTSEARTAVANNNQADLFISLHAGYSPNTADTGSSIYVMKPDFTGGSPEPAGSRLFVPWYMAYRLSEPASQAVAAELQQSLNETLPGWKFPIRFGPIAVLASATMPAVAVEIGNLNNDVSAQTLADPEFQAKVASTIAAGIQRFAVSRSGGPGQ